MANQGLRDFGVYDLNNKNKSEQKAQTTLRLGLIFLAVARFNR